MPLESTAQFVVEDVPMIMDPQENGEHIVIYPSYPEQEVMMELHDPEVTEEAIEAHDQHPDEIQFEIKELPGVDELDPEFEKSLEVQDEAENTSADDAASKSKIPTKWDWQQRGPQGFVTWIQERLHDVPKHSGKDTAGLDRASSYLEKLDDEISKAMRLDLDGELDANRVEEVRAIIETGIEALDARRDKLTQKNKKKKKANAEGELVKEGQKATRIDGIVITVPLLISRIARVCINGMVSAGHDIEVMFKKQCEAYKLTDREKAETMQLLADMGYPMRQDRGFMMNDEVDTTSSDNFDWAANYQG